MTADQLKEIYNADSNININTTCLPVHLSLCIRGKKFYFGNNINDSEERQLQWDPTKIYTIILENGRQYRRNRFSIKFFKESQTSAPRISSGDLFLSSVGPLPPTQPGVLQNSHSTNISVPLHPSGLLQKSSDTRTTHLGHVIRPPKRFTELTDVDI